MNRPPRIIAVRTSKTQTDTLEALCLEWGIDKRFRLYTTTDEDLSESAWELDPIEFDASADPELNTYLIESFWLTEISVQELKVACRLYADGIAETPTIAVHRALMTPLGSLGVLLIEALNRMQTIDPADRDAPDALRRIERRLETLASLPALADSLRNFINECRAACRAMASEALLRRQ